MKRRKYTYNLVTRDAGRYGYNVFELLTDKELQRLNPRPLTRQISVYADNVYYFFGLRYAQHASAKDFAEEIKAHVLDILKRCSVKPENLNDVGRRQLAERAKLEITLSTEAYDVDEVINNIVQNL